MIEQWMRRNLEREISKWPVLPQRFWNKVSMSSTGCWNWTGCKSPSFNLWYPRFFYDCKTFPAHKVMYLVTHGMVPPGFEIHHECRNTLCVNPAHIRAVTSRENRIMSDGPSGINFRKTHCIRGHPLSGDNLIRYEKKRVCKTCQKMWQQSEAFRKLHKSQGDN